MPESLLPPVLFGLVLAATVARAAVATTSAGHVGAAWGFGGLVFTMWAAAHLTGSVRFPVAIDGRLSSILAGGAVAALLVLPGVLIRMPGQHAAVSPGTYIPYVPALIWIASAEELLLRGLLQPLARASVGPVGGIIAVAGLFALMHLPAYGWGAMPLDFGVGVLLGWLREETRSVTACVVAHTLADLGGWFLG